jgi:glycosyltransferase involved in cell wall biosynthesis
MQPIDVLYLVRTWAFGGSHSIVLTLLEHLPRDRYRIHCVPYDAHSPGDAAFIEQAQVRGLEIDDARIPWQSRWGWFRARNAVAKLIDERNIGLIHTHDPHSNTMIGLGRKRWAAPVVASAYGWWDGPPLRRRIHQRIERDYALPDFDRVITVSDNMRQRILEGSTPPEKIHVVRTGFAARPSVDENVLRKQYNLPEDAVVVGTVGRVSPEKGHRHLIEAAARVLPEHPSLYVVIVGTGPALNDLKAQAAKAPAPERIVFTGFWEDLHTALADFDLFAFPSIEREGLPTAVLEAQRAGLPVLASDIGGTKETLVDSETGVLVPPGDIDALERALRDWLASPERWSAMGRAAADRIANDFSLDQMIDQVAQVYDAAIEDFQRARRD